MFKKIKLYYQRAHFLVFFLILTLILSGLSYYLDADIYLSSGLILNIESLLKITLATTAGSIIGYERSYKQRPAGLRTHALVCMGAAIVMIIPLLLSSQNNTLQLDVTRLSAQVISGMGFLGAGTIIRNGSNVRGLTTAATLWVVAIIGLGIGAGLYFLTLMATCVVLLVLRVSTDVETNSDDLTD